MVKYLCGAVLAVILTLIVGIPITASTATLLVFVMSMFFIEEIIDKVKNKKMPSILEWITYGFILAAVILLEIGLFYANVYVLIVALLLIAVALVLTVIDNRKNKNESA